MKAQLLAYVFASISLSYAAISEIEIAMQSAKGLRLISISQGVDPVWKTEDEKLDLIRAKTKFFDVTETYEPNQDLELSSARLASVALAFPPPSHHEAVKPLIGTVSLSNMKLYLSNLTSFNNRYYKSATGAAASVWIRDTVAAVAKTFNASNATVALFSHTFVQSSIIAKIPGTSNDPTVTILGAHMDSINQNSPAAGRAPGADDDGSGAVNLLEAFRVLVSSGFKPSTPVEFHWYAGEEGGLLGSQAVAKAYKAAGVKVKGMLQLDMTAYVKPGTKEVIGLMPDFTSTNLTTFVGTLIDNYTSIPWVINDPCGYACSDHASWNQQGYPTALPFEGLFGDDNPTIHGNGDTVDVVGFSWDHTLEFTKLAVAYAYELGI